MRYFFIIIILAVTLAFPSSAQEVTVFEEGEGGYAGFRIPAIVKAADGSLLAFAEARRNGKGDTGDIDLVMKRSCDRGQSWGGMQVVWDDGENTCGNPAPVVVGRKIVLPVTWNKGCDREKDIERNASEDTRRVFVLISNDSGRTWSEPFEITPDVKDESWGWYATGPCHAIVKTRRPARGRIIVPSNHSELDESGNPVSRSQLIYSDDRGLTWHLGAVTEVAGNESTVAELADGSLMLNMRRSSRTDSVRLYAVSRDGGLSFVEQGRAVSLIEPRCQGSILSLPDRRGRATDRLFFSNPASRSRRNLSLTRSLDGGMTWESAAVVCQGPSAYSDIVLIAPDIIGVLYENGEEGNTYKKISFRTIPI